MHRADPELAYAPVPETEGAHVFPIGPWIPMRYDDQGFRVPVVDRSALTDDGPLILALGCSYTYGDAMYAEDTFSYQIARYLRGNVNNAGVCGYGYAHILILARRLIPKTQPDYVIVQYSKWLTDRAQQPFGPSYGGKIAFPYFVLDQGKLAIQPPVFSTMVCDLALDSYRKSPKSFTDYFHFIAEIGFPLFLHDDYYMAKYFIMRALKLLPTPERNRSLIESEVFREIGDIVRNNGSRLIIVIIGNNEKPVNYNRNIFPRDAIVVDGHAALLDRLSLITYENYVSEYAHWRGWPSRIVDFHINERAHRIIAAEVANKILEDKKKVVDPEPASISTTRDLKIN